MTISSSSLRETAAGILGIAPEATAKQVRAAFLRRLENVEFVPGPESLAALTILADGSEPSSGLAFGRSTDTLAREQDLRIRIASFRAAYWELPPVERRELWSDLAGPAADVIFLRKQLQALEAVLSLDRGQFSDFHGPEREIAELLFNTFALFPPERAARQRAWLDSKIAAASSWARDGRRFRRRHPRLAKLDPVPFERLKKLPAAARERQTASAPRDGFRAMHDLKKSANIVGYFLAMLLVVCIAAILKQRMSSNPSQTGPTTKPLTPTIAPGKGGPDQAVPNIAHQGDERADKVVFRLLTDKKLHAFLVDGTRLTAEAMSEVQVRSTADGELRLFLPDGTPLNQVRGSLEKVPPHIRKLYEEFRRQHPYYPKGRPYAGEATLVLFGLIKPNQPLDRDAVPDKTP